MADTSALGVLVLVIGIVHLLFPQIPFHLQYIELEDAEMSDTGRTLYRMLGGFLILIGLLMVL